MDNLLQKITQESGIVPTYANPDHPILTGSASVLIPGETSDGRPCYIKCPLPALPHILTEPEVLQYIPGAEKEFGLIAYRHGIAEIMIRHLENDIWLTGILGYDVKNLMQPFYTVKFPDLPKTTFQGIVLPEHGQFFCAAYLAFPTIDSQISKLSLPEKHNTALQLAEILGNVHAKEIVHNDVNTGNGYLDRDRGVILGDFGIAEFASGQPPTIGTGTSPFDPVEQKFECSTSNDVYAYGWFLMQMLLNLDKHTVCALALDNTLSEEEYFREDKTGVDSGKFYPNGDYGFFDPNHPWVSVNRALGYLEKRPMLQDILDRNGVNVPLDDKLYDLFTGRSGADYRMIYDMADELKGRQYKSEILTIYNLFGILYPIFVHYSYRCSMENILDSMKTTSSILAGWGFS